MTRAAVTRVGIKKAIDEGLRSFGDVDGIALGAEVVEGVPQRAEYIEVCGGTDCPVGVVAKNGDGEFSLFCGQAAECHGSYGAVHHECAHVGVGEHPLDGEARVTWAIGVVGLNGRDAAPADHPWS